MIWFVAASTPASFTVNLKDGVSKSATKNVAASSHLRGVCRSSVPAGAGRGDGVLVRRGDGVDVIDATL